MMILKMGGEQVIDMTKNEQFKKIFEEQIICNISSRINKDKEDI